MLRAAIFYLIAGLMITVGGSIAFGCDDDDETDSTGPIDGDDDGSGDKRHTQQDEQGRYADGPEEFPATAQQHNEPPEHAAGKQQPRPNERHLGGLQGCRQDDSRDDGNAHPEGKGRPGDTASCRLFFAGTFDDPAGDGQWNGHKGRQNEPVPPQEASG